MQRRDPGLADTEQSEAMRRLQGQVQRAAPTGAPVLIIGESGAGKEVVARRLHALSERASLPFIPVNCGAIPASLIEAELFGHEKGSFTGAIARSLGYFECASGGTLFLDEITEMAPAMQVKLLRVLETGTFHRVGGSEKMQVDVRIIAATNREPLQAVREGRFREDLMYRLAVFPLRVPPLRDRRDDIAALAGLFVDELNRCAGTNRALSRQALETLKNWHWPGNVRELKNVVHRAFILAGDTIEIGPLQPPSGGGMKRGFDGGLKVQLGTPLATVQRELILSTLAHHKGDKRRTAEALGVSLKTLYNRMDLYAASVTG